MPHFLCPMKTQKYIADAYFLLFVLRLLLLMLPLLPLPPILACTHTHNQAGYLFQKLGVVPDQNFVNGVVGLSPNLVHPLGCGWNRQLTSWFLGTNGALIKPNAFLQKRLNTVLNCPETCGMLHFNGDVVKCMVPLLQQANGSCSTWHALIRDIPATTNEQMSNPSACLLRRVFGGEDLPNQTRSAKHDGQIVRAVFQFFGKCCVHAV